MGRIPARRHGAQRCKDPSGVSAQNFERNSLTKVRRPRRLQRKGGHVEMLGTAYRRHPGDVWPGVLEAGNKQGPGSPDRGWILSIHGPRLWLARPWQNLPGWESRLMMQEQHAERQSGIVLSQAP